MQIPKTLIAAKTALEATIANEQAIVRAAAAGAGAVQAATGRIPELDREIERLQGALIADDALAGIAAAGDARMTAEQRLTTEAEFDELRAERDDLAQKSAAGEVAARALQDKIAERGAETLAARRALADEMRRFLRSLEAEFAVDVGRLVLPELFRKWAAITAGVRYSAISTSLAAMQIGVPGAAAPILFQGCYREPAGETDRSLVTLQQQLAEIAAACGNPYTIESEIKRQRHEAQTRANEADNRRRAAEYHRANVSYERVAPAMTRQEREAAEQRRAQGRPDYEPYVPQNVTPRIGGTPAPARPVQQ